MITIGTFIQKGHDIFVVETVNTTTSHRYGHETIDQTLSVVAVRSMAGIAPEGGWDIFAGSEDAFTVLGDPSKEGWEVLSDFAEFVREQGLLNDADPDYVEMNEARTNYFNQLSVDVASYLTDDDLEEDFPTTLHAIADRMEDDMENEEDEELEISTKPKPREVVEESDICQLTRKQAESWLKGLLKKFPEDQANEELNPQTMSNDALERWIKKLDDKDDNGEGFAKYVIVED